jgi:hypothetical protein
MMFAVALGGYRPSRCDPFPLRVAVCRASPRFKRQVGFGKEDQDSVSASATAKHASCCRCAQRTPGIPDRDRPLPSSRPLVHSLCDRTTRSYRADGEAGKIPCSAFYGHRTCGTSRSDGSSSPAAHSIVIGRDPSPAERRVASKNNARPVSCCSISFQGQGCGKPRSGVSCWAMGSQ